MDKLIAQFKANGDSTYKAWNAAQELGCYPTDKVVDAREALNVHPSRAHERVNDAVLPRPAELARQPAPKPPGEGLPGGVGIGRHAPLVDLAK